MLAVALALMLALALARVAAGGARRGLMVVRSGAGRADCPAVLDLAARRGTRCVRFALYAQTATTRMFTNALRAGHKPCAPRRPTNRPRRLPPATPLGLWYSLFRAPAGQPSRRIRSAVRSAQRHKGGARRAEDSRGAECAVGLVPHQATGIRAVMISGTTNNVRNGPDPVRRLLDERTRNRIRRYAVPVTRPGCASSRRSGRSSRAGARAAYRRPPFRASPGPCRPATGRVR